MMEKFKKVSCFFEFFLFDVYIGGTTRKTRFGINVIIINNFIILYYDIYN